MKGCVLFLLIFPIFLSCTDKNSGPASDTSDSIHLRKESRIEYYLNREANTLTETAVKTAFKIWEEATDFTFLYKGRFRAGLRRDGRNTVSFLTRWPKDIPYGKTAYCRNWYDKQGRIVESDIIFNMELARFTTRDSGTQDSYLIEGVLAHEIGHMIGLSHIDHPDSLMKPFSPPEESYFGGKIDQTTLIQYRRLYNLPSPEL